MIRKALANGHEEHPEAVVVVYRRGKDVYMNEIQNCEKYRLGVDKTLGFTSIHCL